MKPERDAVEAPRGGGGRACSARLDAAWALAAVVHQQQLRKGTDIPYIIHPAQVALILDRYGWPEDVVIAGLLHDVIEDAKCDEPELRNRLRAAWAPLRSAPADTGAFREALAAAIGETFGAGVLRLIESVSERKTDGRRRRPWRERKEEQLAALARADRAAAAVKAADLVHNARSIAREVEESGPAVMARFNAEAEEILWYYRASVAVILERLGRDDRLGAELVEALAGLEAALARRA